MDRLRSAAEIVELALPSLPRTKVAIAARAEREGWYHEERTGLGGVRKVYRIPEHYFSGATDGQQLSPHAIASASDLASELAQSYGVWAAAVDPLDFVPVRYYPNIRASAGPGFINSDEPPEAMLFRRSFITGFLQTSPAVLIAVRVDGDSMWPTIKKDGTVLVDLSKRLTGHGIYLVRVGEMLLIKRLQPLVGSRIKVISDNTTYAPYEIDLAKVSPLEFCVVGGYVWDAGIAR